MKIHFLRFSLRIPFILQNNRNENAAFPRPAGCGKACKKQGDKKMSENIVKVENMTKQYGKQLALDNVSFGIKRGSIVGLIGPNGAGKSTIMKSMGGLVFPTSGSLEMFGETTEKGLSHSRTRTSFISETPYAKNNMSARENLEKQRLQKGLPDKGRIDEVLEIVKLGDTGKKEYKKFSLGMKQRLGIANALMSRPELMVLDEPINGLDPEGIVEIRELLRKLNKEEKVTIIISSHILSELSLLCTDYIFINKGKIKDQLTAEELGAECSEFYHIDTDNNELAGAILTKDCGIKELEVLEDGSLRIYDGLEDIRRISKALYEGGVIPTQLARNEVNLEDYYMRKVQADV